MKRFAIIVLIVLPLGDLCWNLANLNVGLVDFYGLAAFAANFAEHQVWPATAYFPAGYPILLAVGGKLGSVLVAGYILSAGGTALALWTIFRMLRHWGAGYGWALTAACLAWVSPTCRIVAGSPSVDSLFTGLALWFMAAALVIWCGDQVGKSIKPGWVRYGLVIPALILPLLRYHGMLVVLPVLAVLLIARRRNWRLAAVAVVAIALAVGFNTFTYQRAFQESIPSSSGLQVRTGIEITNPTHYGSADELFADYAEFSRHGRDVPLLTDYSISAVVKHTVANLAKFIRRVPIALLLISAIVLIALRRFDPPGLLIGSLWLVSYVSVISVAYYTPRSALLPVMLGVVLTAVVVQSIARERQIQVFQAGLVVLLLAGYGLSASYAKLVIEDRLMHHAISINLAETLQEAGIADHGSVAVQDMALLPLTKNPWCRPYVVMSTSWLDDVTIKSCQRNGITGLSFSETEMHDVGIKAMVINIDSPADRLPRESYGWKELKRLDGYVVFSK